MSDSKAKSGNPCQSLAALLEENTEVLAAMGDPARQHILIQMILRTGCRGLRIGEIAEISNLSRAAASRHVKFLVDAGLLEMRKEGTLHYYFFSRTTPALHNLRKLLDLSIEVLDGVSSEEEKEDLL